MTQPSNKFEQLLELLINEENENCTECLGNQTCDEWHDDMGESIMRTWEEVKDQGTGRKVTDKGPYATIAGPKPGAKPIGRKSAQTPAPSNCLLYTSPSPRD